MNMNFSNFSGFREFKEQAEARRGERTINVKPIGKKLRTTLIILYILWVGISYYIQLPPINIHSTVFWNYLAFEIILPGVILIGFNNIVEFLQGGMDKKILKKPMKWGIIAVIGLVAFVFLASIYGLEIFHAKEYASILQTKDYEFTEDIDQSSALSKIALMDTSSAIKLGNREIGTLSELVSQYNVSSDYTQIDYNGNPLKVTTLEYTDFFKYWANKEAGVPGMVQVDPVNQTAKYVAFEKGMRYVPSGYFNDRLERHLRFQFPTKIFGNIHFEINEEGHPYYVASVYGYKVGMFNGETVIGAIVCDPISGESNYYELADVPQWVDEVFDGNLLVEQYNWNGLLSNGFINSQFAKRGVKRATETKNDYNGTQPDFGYIAKDGDIWIYTGVTSVNDDASNIGFILVNERTGDAHYYAIPGADENSAMSAAEGEVQEKGYQASFPSLINVDEKPTYVMVLKDASGIVKLYAMVNVEQYNIVTTASSLDACFEKYRALIGTADSEIKPEGKPDASESDDKEEDSKPSTDAEDITAVFTIKSIQYVGIEGNTYVYLEGSDGNVYRQKFAENESLITLRQGDEVKVVCSKKSANTFNISVISKGATFNHDTTTDNNSSKEPDKKPAA